MSTTSTPQLPEDDITLWNTILNEQAIQSKHNIEQDTDAGVFISAFLTTRKGNRDLIYPTELRQQQYLELIYVVLQKLLKITKLQPIPLDSLLNLVSMYAYSITVVGTKIFDTPIYDYRIWLQLNLSLTAIEPLDRVDAVLIFEAQQALDNFQFHPDHLDLQYNHGVSIANK